VNCPICNKEINRPIRHLRDVKDEGHQHLYKQQLQIAENLFNNIEFTKSSNVEDYGLVLTYKNCLKIWQEKFGKEECKKRANKLNGINVSKALKGKPKSEEHSKAVSEALKGNTPWNKGLTVEDPRVRAYRNKVNETMSKVLTEMYATGEMVAWSMGKTKETDERIKNASEKTSKTMANNPQNNSWGISGIRKDIGHHAASTYEANVYRILQYHGCKYLKEFDIIKPIILPDGSKRDYRLDILDVEGLFGVKGAYIEVKGFFNERDRLKVECFRKQYPNETLLMLGNGDKREKYYWESDIDYAKLENKYKPLIPLWEDKNQNLRKNPELYEEIHYEISNSIG
jgi:hypothetical protein